MNTIRIPTITYGYFEVEFKGTPEETINEHNRLIKLYQDSLKEPEIQTGMDTKSWQKCLDNYLTENILYEEDVTSMSKNQALLINELKKAFSRIKNREQK